MKKLFALSIVCCVIGFSAYAEDGLTFSGEVKTGFNITKDGDADAAGQVKNSDDAGTPGRIRMNFNYVKGNIQFKSRFEVTESVAWGDYKGAGERGGDQGFTTSSNSGARFLRYAYAMGDFWDNQFRMSLGKIGGDKPWETSGDEIWASIEEITGARFEFKPNAVPGLNVGLLIPAVVAGWRQKDNNGTLEWENAIFPSKIEDYLMELGFGVRYENDALDARLAFRLDGEGDGEWAWDSDNSKPYRDANNDLYRWDAGAVFMYRLNIKAIGNMVPGLSLWLNGRFQGIKTVSGVPDDYLKTEDWLYVRYAQDPFSAQLRLGLETNGENRDSTLTVLRIKPFFTYKLTSWAQAGLTVLCDLGLAYKDGLKYGGDDPSLLREIMLEPGVAFTLSPGATITPVYTLQIYPDKSASNQGGDSKLKHQFEIRFVYSF